MPPSFPMEKLKQIRNELQEAIRLVKAASGGPSSSQTQSSSSTPSQTSQRSGSSGASAPVAPQVSSRVLLHFVLSDISPPLSLWFVP